MINIMKNRRVPVPENRQLPATTKRRELTPAQREAIESYAATFEQNETLRAGLEDLAERHDNEVREYKHQIAILQAQLAEVQHLLRTKEVALEGFRNYAVGIRAHLQTIVRVCTDAHNRAIAGVEMPQTQPEDRVSEYAPQFREPGPVTSVDYEKEMATMTEDIQAEKIAQKFGSTLKREE